jgi:hypothetical protein
MAHIRQAAKDDVRWFLAPFVGAANAVKEELNRVDARQAAAKKRPCSVKRLQQDIESMKKAPSEGAFFT